MYDFLRKPLQLGSLTLRHRLVLAPHGHGKGR